MKLLREDLCACGKWMLRKKLRMGGARDICMERKEQNSRKHQKTHTSA